MPDRLREHPSPKDPRFFAALDMLKRLGATSVSIRYQDDEDPVVWVVYAGFGGDHGEAAGALDPLTASIRLLEVLMDGGECRHCHRPTGVSDDWEHTMPLQDHVCWYIYDPETEKFRRGCEGDA